MNITIILVSLILCLFFIGLIVGISKDFRRQQKEEGIKDFDERQKNTMNQAAKVAFIVLSSLCLIDGTVCILNLLPPEYFGISSIISVLIALCVFILICIWKDVCRRPGEKKGSILISIAMITSSICFIMIKCLLENQKELSLIFGATAAISIIVLINWIIKSNLDNKKECSEDKHSGVFINEKPQA